MMKIATLLLALAVSVPAFAQTSPALQCAKFDKCPDRVTADKFAAFFYVNAFSPFNRVVQMARQKAAMYMPVTDADITDDLVRPELWIYVLPETELAKHQAMATHVVVRSSKGVAQPSIIEPTTQNYQNGFGATFTTGGLSAKFNLADIEGEFDVIVVTSWGGEEKFSFRGKRYQQLHLKDQVR